MFLRDLGDRGVYLDMDNLDALYDSGTYIHTIDPHKYRSSFRNRRYEEALECYNKAIKINPDDKEAWFLKGSVLRSMTSNDQLMKMIIDLISFPGKTVSPDEIEFGRKYLKISICWQEFPGIKHPKKP